MEHHGAAGDYKDLVLFLITAGVAVPLFRRFKISPILGFLIGGVVLGPFGLGSLARYAPWLSSFTVGNPQEIGQLAEFGVVFLLFMIGLELSWERLRLMRRLVFGMGALQMVLCGGVIAGAGVALGLPIAAAVAFGAALAPSSTAIVMPLLAEHKRQHSAAGRATFSVLLFQDLAVGPILITLAVLGAQGGAEFSPKLLLAFAPAMIGLSLLVIVGRVALRPMMRSVARARSEELFMAACLLVVIGAGLVAALAGLSMALGAFVAGLLLAETEYRHEVEVTIEPFKGLLLGLFFVSVGIGLDVSLLVRRPVEVLGLAVGLVSLNAAVIFGLARLFKLRAATAAETALLLAGGGEFAFVILGSAMDKGVAPAGAGQLVLVASTLSMMSIPLLAVLARRIGDKAPTEVIQAPGDVTAEPPEGMTAPAVLVVGYGRVGKLVGDMLGRHGISWIAVDRDPRLIEAGRRAGHEIYFGDASKPEFVKRVGLLEAKALVVTMDDPDGTEAVAAAALEMRPGLTVVARARDARHAARLYALGVTDAVPETIEASLQLSETVLVDVGVPMGLVIASIHERRDEFRKALNRPEALGARVRRFRRSQA